MRPCYWYKEKGERFLIPGCMSVAHSNDIRDCTCDRGRHKKDLEERIELLEKQVKELMKVLKNTV